MKSASSSICWFVSFLFSGGLSFGAFFKLSRSEEKKMWGAGDYGDQTPMQRRPSMGAGARPSLPITTMKGLFKICAIYTDLPTTGTEYGDSTAPRTAQRTVMTSYLFPSTPVPHSPRQNGRGGS
jgi:hypothetical protein